VSAVDKASGKEQKVTITSDKGRLSQEEIDRMIQEAEENAEADRLVKLKVEAKNQLESYLYSLQNTVRDTLKDKLSDADKESILSSTKTALSWLEEHPNEEKEAYDDKRKEVEDVANPIITRAYNAGAGAGREEASPNSSSPKTAGADAGSGPTVEEM
jgi:endoplasmic reticulum chaperone BiP